MKGYLNSVQACEILDILQPNLSYYVKVGKLNVAKKEGNKHYFRYEDVIGLDQQRTKKFNIPKARNLILEYLGNDSDCEITHTKITKITLDGATEVHNIKCDIGNESIVLNATNLIELQCQLAEFKIDETA